MGARRLLVGLLFLPLSAAPAGLNYAARVERVLAQTPLIDGHNDLPWELRSRFKGNLSSIDLKSDTSSISTPADSPPLMTDIPRLRAGHGGAQFWSVWVPVSLPGFEAVQTTIEQIDLVKRMAMRYPSDLEMAYSALPSSTSP
jgi:membrane dipeptidase